jgi:hypothetical protein
MQVIITIVVVLVVVALLVARIAVRKNTHSSAQMLRFAGNSARDVLSSNWTHDEYYARMYQYASPELASHMYKNRSLLNNVLDERCDLLGSFVEIRGLELRSQGFGLLPSRIYEVAGTLQCSKGCVPVVILVNADKEDLCLDGIRVLKKLVEIKDEVSKGQGKAASG